MVLVGNSKWYNLPKYWRMYVWTTHIELWTLGRVYSLDSRVLNRNQKNWQFSCQIGFQWKLYLVSPQATAFLGRKILFPMNALKKIKNRIITVQKNDFDCVQVFFEELQTSNFQMNSHYQYNFKYNEKQRTHVFFCRELKIKSSLMCVLLAMSFQP